MNKPKANKNLGNVDISALKELAKEYPSTQAEVSKTEEEKPKEPEVALTFKVPAYVARQLKIQAAMGGKTQREVLLEALQKLGIEVRAEDIVDRRKS